MVLSTRAHGYLDLASAAVLIGRPWTLGLVPEGAAGWVLMAVGAAVLANMLLTDFERGIARRIQIPVHLWIDGLAGLLLVVSPWLFSFDQRVWIPHVVLGVVLMAVAFFTNTVPGYERRRSEQTARE